MSKPYQEVIYPEWMEGSECINNPEFIRDHMFTWPEPEEHVYDVTLRLPASALVVLGELIGGAFMDSYRKGEPSAALALISHQLNGHKGGRITEVFPPEEEEDV
jgi:hypothetical protein